MNFELLKKLTRLANNNPNDNEANLAARKVCKMLAESDFAYVQQLPPEPHKTEPKSTSTWKRSSEPQWRSSYYDGTDVNFDYVNNWVKNYYKEKEEQYRPTEEMHITYEARTDTYIMPDGTTMSSLDFKNYPPSRWRGLRIVYK